MTRARQLRSRDGVDTGARVDLASLARRLANAFAAAPPVDYVPGKTALRDAVAAFLGCSSLRAEELVDALERGGFVHYDGDPFVTGGAPGVWTIAG